MQSYPSPPRHGSSPPPRPLIRSINQASELTSEAEVAATLISSSERDSSHNPPRRSPYANVSRRTQFARNSLPSPPRSVSPPAIYGDDRSCGESSNSDAVLRFPFEPEVLQGRYLSMRHRVAEVMFTRDGCEGWSSANPYMLSSVNVLPRSCGTFWTFQAVAWSSTIPAMISRREERSLNLKFRLYNGKVILKTSSRARVRDRDVLEA